MIRSNVRTPDAVFGDLAAQVSSGRAASERLIGMCRRYGLPDIELLSDEIIRRSEEATRVGDPQAQGRHLRRREQVRRSRRRDHHAEGRRDDRRRATARSPSISPAARRRPRPASTWCSTTPTPIRPSRCAAASIRICPTTPAAWRRSRCSAPEGSIVNCTYPAPVNARHVVGMYVPMPILKALYQVMPERVLAEGSGAVWTMQIQGRRAGRRALHLLDVQLFRRHGRARDQAGTERHLLSDRRGGGADRDPRSGRCRSSSTARSCGPAPAAPDASRGGDGQIIQFRMQTEDPWLLNAVPSRLDAGPGGPRRRRPGRGRTLPGERQAGAAKRKKLTLAARRRRAARNAGRRRLRPAGRKLIEQED